MERMALIVSLMLALPAGGAAAQTTPAAPTGQKTLAATLGISMFPSDGQKPEQQSKDESECYTWAVQNTGTDPFALAKKTEEQKAQAEAAQKQAAQAGKGAGAKGAVKGAATGALIGEIASDDAGEGAAYGAAAGVIAGRRKGKAAQKQAQQQAQGQSEQAAKATEEQMAGFRKAFSACAEAKKYVVKF